MSKVFVVLFCLLLFSSCVFGASIIQIRRDTAANWVVANPTLAQGELGFETDTLKLKLGDGVTAWNGLAYYSSAGTDINGEDIRPSAVSVDRNLSVRGDANFVALEADFFFGDGSGITGITSTPDINGEDVILNNVFVDNNLSVLGDANFFNLEADFFFGNGAGLTGIGYLWDTNAQTACMAYADLLGGTGLCIDLNVNRYLASDINSHFAPILSPTFLGDANFFNIEADFFFGDGSGLTGVSVASDVNGADIRPSAVSVDRNLSVRGDANFVNVQASYFFGDGSGLTGLVFSSILRTYTGTHPIEVDSDTNVVSLANDFNDSYYNKFNDSLQYTADVNDFFIQIQNGFNYDSNADTACAAYAEYLGGTGLCVDLNVNRYLASDINAHFAPILSPNILGDANFVNVEADYFFGDGSGLTNLSSAADGFSPLVIPWADENVANNITVAWAGLTDVPYIPNENDIDWNAMELDTNFQTFGDFNSWYYDKFGNSLQYTADVNDFFVQIQNAFDYDSNFQTFADFNSIYASLFSGATFTGDINSVNIEADYFFGDGSGLTNLTATADVNGADIRPSAVSVDRNLSVRGDANFANLQADNAYLTELTVANDINAIGDSNFVSITTSGNLFIEGKAFYPEDHSDFTDDHELVDKEYVDKAVTAINTSYYLYDDASGISDYKLTQIVSSPDAETSVTDAGLADNDYIQGWISPVDANISTLIGGTYELHITAEKTAGTEILQLYWQLVERNIDTTESVIAVSEVGEIVDAKEPQEIHLILLGDHDVNSDGRIVGKIYATVTGGGTAPTSVLYYRGETVSAWNVPSNTEVLQDTFYSKTDINAGWLPYVGAISDTNTASQGITAWDINSFTVEANYFFGDGSGLTNLTATADVNGADIRPSAVSIDRNLSVRGDANFFNAEADYFFGDGSGITGLVYSSILRTYTGTHPIEIDSDTNIVSLAADFNDSYYNKFGDSLQYTADVNNFFVQIQNAFGYDSNFQTFADFNSIYASLFSGADFVGDINSVNIEADYFFGDGSGLTNLSSAADGFSPLVIPWADENVANNITVAWAGLTDVPYIPNEDDIDWNGMELDSNFMTFGDFNEWYWSKYSTDLNVIIDVKAMLQDTNIFTSGVSDCAAGNYVYGFNTDGTIDCRVDAGGAAGGRTYTAETPVKIDNDLNTIGLLSDFNSWYYDKFGNSLQYTADVNDFFVQIQNAFDYDSNFQTFADFNNVYASLFGASFIGDVNSVNVEADYFFGDGSGITGLSYSSILRTYTGTHPIEIDSDTNVISLAADFNDSYYNKFGDSLQYTADVNDFFVQIQNAFDYDSNFQTFADFNSAFASLFSGANFVGDINSVNIEADYFFGDGSGLTNLSSTSDGFSPLVIPWADENVANDITVAYAGITGHPYIPNEQDIDWNAMEWDTNFSTFADFNSWYYNKFGDSLQYTADVNDFFVQIQHGFDYDSNFQTFADFNSIYASLFSGANFVGDVNSVNIEADYFFGDGSGLLNVSATADVNGADIRPSAVSVDRNLSVRGDANFVNVQANYFFGDGSGITGLSYSSILRTYTGTHPIEIDSDTNIVSLATDFNDSYYNKFNDSLQYTADVNDFFVQIQHGFNYDSNADTACTNYADFLGGTGICIDLNTNRYLASDINAHFAPILSPTFLGDVNSVNIEADYFFGDGSGLTNLPSGGVYLPDSTLDNNILAQAYYWDNLNLLFPVPDANVADNITVEWAGLTGVPYIPTETDIDNNASALMKPDTTLDTNATAETSWLGKNHSFTADQNFTGIGLTNLFATSLFGNLAWNYLTSVPYIPTEQDIDLNAMAWDTNFTTYADFNSDYASNYNTNLIGDTNSDRIQTDQVFIGGFVFDHNGTHLRIGK